MSLGPSLLEAQFGSVLILGGTRSGKTFGLKTILNGLLSSKENKGKKMYTINVKDSEYVDEFRNNHLRIQLDKREQIKPGSVVVVEDIIDLTTKDKISLRLLLN